MIAPSLNDRISASGLNVYLLLAVLVLLPIVAIIFDDRLLLHIPFAIPYYCQSHFVDFHEFSKGGIIEHIPRDERIQTCVDNKGIASATKR